MVIKPMQIFFQKDERVERDIKSCIAKKSGGGKTIAQNYRIIVL
jgi:hypothetical protein